MTVRRSIRQLAAAALAILLVAGCGSETPDKPPASSAPAPRYPVDPSTGSALSYQIPGMDTIVPNSDVYTTTAGGATLDIDLCLPDSGSKPPVVLLLHGVTPDTSPKNFGALVGWGQALAKSGVAAAVINYRADEGGDDPGSTDVQDAIDHLRKDSRVDASRLGLLTFSAGGPYTVRAASKKPQGLRAIGLFYARTELPGSAPVPATSLSALVADQPALPVFAAYGEDDVVAGIKGSEHQLQKQVGSRGSGPVVIRTHPSAGHVFDTVEDAKSAQIVRMGVEFFVNHLVG